MRAAGASDADARRAAREELGDAGVLAERIGALAKSHRPARIPPAGRRGLLRGVSYDLRYAIRTGASRASPRSSSPRWPLVLPFVAPS